MKLLLLPLLSLFLITDLAKSDEMAIKSCVINYRNQMGLSTDLAFKECKKISLVECIKKLKVFAPTYKAIAKEEKGYVIDLGEDKENWQEGAFWKERNCKVNKKFGENITRNMKDKNGFQQRYRWFRQGLCQKDLIIGAIPSDQMAYKSCDPAGYLTDGKFNINDSETIDNMTRNQNGQFLDQGK